MQRSDLSYSYDQYGYMLQYKGQNIGGAGVMGKPKMHWKHAQQNRIDNREYCESEIKHILSGGGQKRFLDVIARIEILSQAA